MLNKSIVMKVLLTVSFFISCGVSAGTQELSPELKAVMGIKDIPAKNRKVIGTWFNRDNGCTRSFEESNGKYYDVARCKDGSGGKSGPQIAKKSLTVFHPIPPKRDGDHYVIQNNGDLEIRDNQGIIDTLPKHNNLWP